MLKIAISKAIEASTPITVALPSSGPSATIILVRKMTLAISHTAVFSRITWRPSAGMQHPSSISAHWYTTIAGSAWSISSSTLLSSTLCVALSRAGKVQALPSSAI